MRSNINFKSSSLHRLHWCATILPVSSARLLTISWKTIYSSVEPKKTNRLGLDTWYTLHYWSKLNKFWNVLNSWIWGRTENRLALMKYRYWYDKVTYRCCAVLPYSTNFKRMHASSSTYTRKGRFTNPKGGRGCGKVWGEKACWKSTLDACRTCTSGARQLSSVLRAGLNRSRWR